MSDTAILPHTDVTSSSSGPNVMSAGNAAFSAQSSPAHQAWNSDDDSETSSDEGEGVFFGTHSAGEASYLAKVSIASPLPLTTSKERASRMSGRVKRDSREFHRRKTLCLSLGHNVEDDAEKVWEGGFYEKDSRTSQQPEEGETTSNLVDSLSTIRLEDSASPVRTTSPSPSCAGESSYGGSSEGEDSDKENTIHPHAAVDEEEVGEEQGCDYLPITLGMQTQDTESEDEAVVLNMGNMKLSDFDDPETGFDGDAGSSSRYSETDEESHDEDEVGGILDSPTLHASLPDLANQSEQAVLHLLNAFEGPDDFDLPSVARSASRPLDSYHFQPIPADPGSPYREIPQAEFVSSADDQPSSLPMLSPPRQAAIASPFIARTPRQLEPLPSATPRLHPDVPVVGLTANRPKVLKSSLAGPIVPGSISKAPEISQKDKKRALAVRGKLDIALPNRMSAMGPPQRTVSSSSSGSSGSRPPSRTEPRKLGGPSKPSQTLPSSKIAIPPRPPTGSSVPLSHSTRPAPPTRVPLTATTIPRPPSVLGKHPANAPRPALAPRSLDQHPPKQPARLPLLKPARPASASPRPVVAAVPSSHVTVLPNPLKRPLLSFSQPSGGKAVVHTGTAPRPLLGLPARLVRDGPSPVPVFHIGAVETVSGLGAAVRSIHKSPAGKPSQKRMFGTPSSIRGFKTASPFRPSSVPVFQTLAPLAAPVQDVSYVEPSASSGPPATATRQATNGESSSPPQARGSSEDHQDVSLLLTQPESERDSSPTEVPSFKTHAPPRKVDKAAAAKEAKDDKAEEVSSKTHRPKRAATTRPAKQTQFNFSNVPQISEKELKTATTRNTMRNQVYHCAIDRQIIRKPGPRPPSPTSKIRTTADRDEEEKKKGRGERAKRRAKGEEDDGSDDDEWERPLVQRIETVRGPGDDEDWVTPARPSKKSKTSHEKDQDKEKGKNVRWDRGLVIIRNDGSAVNPPSGEVEVPEKSALREEARVELDKFGNIIETNRPKENLKRTRIVVTAVFYDGEEPVPVPEAPSSHPSSGGKGKKK